MSLWASFANAITQYFCFTFRYTLNFKIEKHFKKSYNTKMNTLSIVSAYASSVGSAYNLFFAAPVSSVQESYSAEKHSSEAVSSYGEINDEAIISSEAKALLAAEESSNQNALPDKSESENKGAENKLTDDEQKEVSRLKSRDSEVRMHEQAHIAASGGMASGPSYTYETGPDGKKYAVEGEVNISFQDSDDPNKDIENAKTMKAAAMAPVEPSAKDMAAVREADRIIAEATKELSQAESEDATQSGKNEPVVETKAKTNNETEKVTDSEQKTKPEVILA